MKKLIFALAAAVVVLFLLSCRSPEQRALDYWFEAQMRGNSSAAIEYLTRAIRLNPTARYQFDRGEVHARRGEFDRAIADFDETLRLNPGHRGALVSRANAHEQNGDLDHAFADLAEIIRLSSDEPSGSWHIQAYYNRARFHLRHGEYELAIRDFTRMAQLSSDEPSSFEHIQAYYNRAQVHLGQEEYELAILDFTVAVQYPSRFLSAAHLWRGLAHMETGAFNLAIADFTEAIAHSPQDVQVVRAYEFAKAYSWRGVAHFERGNFDLAIADFTEAILLNPSLAVMSQEEIRHRNWSDSFNQQRLMVERMRIQSLYRRPVGSRPTRAIDATLNLVNERSRQQAITNVNNIMAANAHVEWARRQLDRIGREMSGVTLWPLPDFATAHVRRGLVHFERGDYGLAIADFEDSLRIDPDSFMAWEQLEAALGFEPEHSFASEILRMAKNQ